MPEISPERLLVSYGRRRGRKLRPTKQGLYDTLLPKLTLDVSGEGVIDPARIFPDQKEHWLEIGFGGGEHLAHQAGLYPQAGIIGFEPYVNGIAGLLKHIDDHALSNIRIHTHDARPVIDRLPDASIDKIFILYPDPWPKERHKKRRLVSTNLLNVLARVMKPGAQLRLASDDYDYITWMLERLQPHPSFTWQAKESADWLNPLSDWISTKYEQKALAAGRVPTYLNFIRS